MLGHSQHLAVRSLKDVVQGDWKGRNTKRVSSTLEAKWNVFKEWVNLTDSNAGGRSSKNRAKIGLIPFWLELILNIVLFFREWFPRRIGMKAWLECFQENMRAVILCPQECALFSTGLPKTWAPALVSLVALFPLQQGERNYREQGETCPNCRHKGAVGGKERACRKKVVHWTATAGD